MAGVHTEVLTAGGLEACAASASARLLREAQLHIRRSNFREAGRLLEMARLLDPESREIRATWNEVTRILNRPPPEWEDCAWWEEPTPCRNETCLDFLICFEEGFEEAKALAAKAARLSRMSGEQGGPEDSR